MEKTSKQPCPIKARIGQIYSSLAKLKPDFKDRPQQKKLISAAAHVMSLEEKAILISEAGTGTGKSFASLLGVVPFAMANEKKTLIATASNTLLDQLVNIDLPRFKAAFDQPITFFAMKGRGRYCCPKNLYALSSGVDQPEQSSDDDVFERPAFKFKPNQEDLDSIQHMDHVLGEGLWDGDRDALTIPVSDNTWQAVSTDSNSCKRAKCQYFKNCPYYLKKRQMETADIIVTNHDFLLSDMAMDGGVILPAYSNMAFIIDEAHHFPDRAISASAARYTIKLHSNMLGKVEVLLNKMRSVVMSFQYDIKPLVDLGVELSVQVGHSFDYFDALHKKFAKDDEPFLMLKVADEHVSPLFHNICVIAESLQTKFHQLNTTLADFIKERELESDVTDKLLSDLAFYAGYVRTTLKTFTVLSEPDAPGEPPYARWMEKSARGNDLIINTSSIDVSEFIRDTLLNAAYKTIFMSATITNMGDFGPFIRETKADSQQYFTLKVDSPFDYTKSQIVLPDIKSDANDLHGHAFDVAALLNNEPLDTPTGHLVIFTSRRKLNAVVALLKPEILQYCHIQDGTLSKSTIIQRHKDAINAGKPSLILGLTSFSEGVDLPHELCTHVFLDKLPFSPVREPILIAKVEYYESLGLDTFQTISIPDAFRKLTQITGRLIRTEQDYGRITIADNRARNKTYAKKMIKALPSFTIVQ